MKTKRGEVLVLADSSDIKSLTVAQVINGSVALGVNDADSADNNMPIIVGHMSPEQAVKLARALLRAAGREATAAGIV